MVDAIGVYSKRGENADETDYRGHVYRCECGRGIFKPYDKRLRPVELEQIALPE